MHRDRRVIALTALILAVVVSPAHGQFFEPDALVLGRPIPEWIADGENWEEYLNAQDPPLNPDVHPDDLDTIMNDGPVFFVAGLDINNPNSTVRVPANRPILQRLRSIPYFRTPEEVDANDIPLWASEEPLDGVRPADPDFILQELSSFADGLSFFWDYDGVALTEEEIDAHRYTVQYTAVIHPGDEFLPDGEWPLSAVAGVWFMHEPFELGESHTVSLGGVQDDGSRFPIFNVRLAAVPEPCSLWLGIAAGLAVLCVARRTGRRAS